MSVTRMARADRVEATRSAILEAAERLFAERGFGVSNRQIGEAAGQGNTAAVGYHFGAKEDLVRAVVRRHLPRIERLRAPILADVEGSSAVRDWLTCLVVPMTTYLDALGSPTWFARFHAQATTEPALREIVAAEARHSAPLVAALDGLHRCLPGLPPEVLEERGSMARLLQLHTCAEREKALAEGLPTTWRSWTETAAGLVDVLTAVWQAPTTPAPLSR